MHRILIIILITIFFNQTTFAQKFSEIQIAKVADMTNELISGKNIGNGVKAINCSAIGRTIYFKYSVPKDWKAPNNLKEATIEDYLSTGVAELYSYNDITIALYYYHENLIIHKTIILPDEMISGKYVFELDNYISIKNHPKSKGVNMKIKPPLKWEIEEGDRPDIVKKFRYENNSYMIVTKNNPESLSKNEAKVLLNELVSNKEYMLEFSKSFSQNMKTMQLNDYKIVSIDSYPAIQVRLKGTTERLGTTIDIFSIIWIIVYENSLITINASSNTQEAYNQLEKTYFLITNSIIFPDQYK